MRKLFIIFVVISLGECQTKRDESKFPDDFLFGAASAAYQIEGAWNESGKSPSIWDNFVHKHPEEVLNRSTADVACDSYNKYLEDIKILETLKVNHYRFSFSWSRLLPKGYRGPVNQDGLDYYHKLLNELEKRNITPFATIYHWDHPQILEDQFGGWLDEWMIYVFADYAEFIFENFAHRVKHFVTINEPEAYCEVVYTLGYFPPAIKLNGTGDYICMHNMLKAHTMAYEIYNKKYRRKPHDGKIGTVIHCNHPYSNETNGLSFTDLAYEFKCGWVANPIHSKTGDYPKIMKEVIAERSRAQGYTSSRLPTFSQGWINRIKGTSDYFGLNYYTAYNITSLPISTIVDWPNDNGLTWQQDKKWVAAQGIWLKIVPEGLGEMLRLVRDKYDNPLVYILENGFGDGNGTNDGLRVSALVDHLKAVLSAINDGCNIKAYTFWSFMDSFEWTFGYTNQYGLVHVDFESKYKNRTLKKSAMVYRDIIQHRQLPPFN